MDHQIISLAFEVFVAKISTPRQSTTLPLVPDAGKDFFDRRNNWHLTFGRRHY
jgi:hypothetical protein